MRALSDEMLDYDSATAGECPRISALLKKVDQVPEILRGYLLQLLQQPPVDRSPLFLVVEQPTLSIENPKILSKVCMPCFYDTICINQFISFTRPNFCQNKRRGEWRRK